MVKGEDIREQGEINIRSVRHRCAFFNDFREITISLLVAVLMFIVAISRTGYVGTMDICVATASVSSTVQQSLEAEAQFSLIELLLQLSGFIGFIAFIAFVIFFRGRQVIFQTSKDRFVVFRSKKKTEDFYYSEIIDIKSEGRKLLFLWRGYNVTIVTRLKTSTYRLICSESMPFENTIFADLKENVRVWQEEHSKEQLQKNEI